MSKYYEDDELPVDEDYHDEFYDSEENSSYYDSDNDSCYIQNNDSITCELSAIKRVEVQWRNLKIGNTTIQVSSNGFIKPSNSLFEGTTSGFIVPGTPYRTFTVKYDNDDHREYYVHELVWKAFNDTIPEGWIVRHKPEYTSFHKSNKPYSNALCNLNIYENTIHKLI